MWNFDELFTEGNVVGIKDILDDEIFVYTVLNKRYWNKEYTINWSNFKNNKLLCQSLGEQIEYIVKLDNQGNSIILFNREKDMPDARFELKNGMFVTVVFDDDYSMPVHGYVDMDRNTIIYQNGSFDYIDRMIDSKYSKIVAIYSDDVYCYNQCVNYNIEWINNDYKKYL